MDILIKNEIANSLLNMKVEKKEVELLETIINNKAKSTTSFGALKFEEPKNIIKDFLMEENIKVTEEAKTLVSALIKNNIGVNKQTFTNLKRAVQINNFKNPTENYENLQKENLQKAVFTIANEIKVTSSNINAVEHFSKNITLHSQIEIVLENVQKTYEIPPYKGENIAEAVTYILNKDIQVEKKFSGENYEKNPKENYENIIKNFSFELNEKEQIDLKIKSLHTNVKEALEFLEEIVKDENFIKTLTEENVEELEILKNNLQTTRDSCTILTQLKDVTYIPLGVTISNEIREAEIYIFKNNKVSNEKGSVSALVSLNMEHIGKIETYVIKQERDLMLEFKLENEYAENIIKENIGSLNVLLNSYNVKSIAYSKLKEPFSILDLVHIEEEPINFLGNTIEHKL